MDNIDVLPLQHLAEIPISFHLRPAKLKPGFQVFRIDVANRQQFGGRIDPGQMGLAHPADPDHRFGQYLAGRSYARAAQNMARHNADGRQRGDGGP